MESARLSVLFLLSFLGLPPPAGDDPPVLKEFELSAPPGKYCPLEEAELREVVSYGREEALLGTYFFYWYDIESKAHFLNHDGTDALVDHPVRSEGFSYRSAAWWKRELLDVSDAGIDFILPVFWGCPGHPDSWSFDGLPPLVEAFEALDREGKRPPRIGMFYDTTTLRHNPAERRIDPSNEAGKRWFYATIRDFFSLIPPKAWAAIDGRPIVALYSPDFAARQDAALFPDLRQRFKGDFKTDLHLIKSPGWEGAADGTCAWGGALGIQIHSVASLGPGYDHHAVPNRKPLVVDREDGAFYERMWESLLARKASRRPRIVMIETWNELHEGTDVCETKEYGRQYIDLTAKYAKLFKAGAVIEIKGPFNGARSVAWEAGRPEERLGISMPNAGDGLVRAAEIEGRPCRRTVPNPHGGRYVYLGLDDSFLFDEERASVIVEVEYLDRDFGVFALQYDSIDPVASVREGAFKQGKHEVRCKGSGEWIRASMGIPDGRFANRCNGADFRLAVMEGDLAVCRVTVTLHPRGMDGDPAEGADREHE